MIEMSRLRLGVLAVVFSFTGALSSCCGGVHSHKCDFTSWMSQQDAGSKDGPMTCGTQVCDKTQVCCLKKIAPYASCIDPADFQTDQCESTQVKANCLIPEDCDGGGQVCCLDYNAASITCSSPGDCPGDGIGKSGTYLTCATYIDCPAQTPGACMLVQQQGDAGLSLCAPQ